MANQRRVGVVVETVEQLPGLWCTACALPSGWRTTFAVRFGPRMHLQTRDFCDECESTRHIEPC